MAGNVQEKQLRWYNIALMSFITVWGFGNVVNNYANQVDLPLYFQTSVIT
ncbi:transporter [Shigella boydii]|uniref:Transporter n=4 Tax=Shigella TaxID=620 RepID=A0A2S8D6H7_SHIDY|nr:hypothetical protein [Shigella dysenteriae]EFW48357.1 putative transport protein [Shigella dysenteriae CDC 74-1112]EFW61501.1 putative transport protein [Shigella flexneri CDC 796-83]EGJ02528.1 amino acid permease family domain protein [Shigella boydii 3594-74]EIQ14912.1 putative transport protein [Shigella flexneri CCH060]EIQ45573.1 putative transport protein [Shigella boydii 4444-74]EJZ65622.1 putative transport domain protein [Shigella flexneri 1485-80]MBC3915647.1 transporter [Shigell